MSESRYSSTASPDVRWRRMIRARGALSLKAAEHRGADVLAPVNGLGASVSVARQDALAKLGDELARSALKLLGDLDDQGEK